MIFLKSLWERYKWARIDKSRLVHATCARTCIGMGRKMRRNTRYMEGIEVFRRERLAEILHLLHTQGRVEVDILAKRYDVGVDSIRKDLQYLSAHNLCKRVYGGALKASDPELVRQYLERHGMSSVLEEAQSPNLSMEPHKECATSKPDDTNPIPSLTNPLPTLPVAEPSCDNASEKEAFRAVAARAYREINDKDSIFLDLSRINIELAHMLAQGEKRAIVTTNSLDVLQVLAGAPHITTLATGGFLNVQINGFVGSDTISLLEPLLFSKAFIGAGAIDLDNMAIMSSDIDGGSVKERVIHNASYTFLLANKEKFARKESYRFATITDFSAIITDCKDTHTLERLQRTGTPVLRA